MISSEILHAFNLSSAYSIEQIGTGHIHLTYKLTGQRSFILQRVNKEVFRQPDLIAANLRAASAYLKTTFPEYNFLGALPAANGFDVVYDELGYPWRLFPFQENTMTIDEVATPAEALSAAREFGRLTRYLDKIDILKFNETIPQFHDLDLRYRQFEMAFAKATPERREQAEKEIQSCFDCFTLVEQYNQLIEERSLPLRVTHNDTKINNILFDTVSHEAIGVIDLDTLMPGYFIYDLGDMIRTFVSPVSEEEKDFSKILFRNEIYNALMDGYLSQMNEIMTVEEKKAIRFAGKMMTFIMALRFLADFLNGNIYYQIKYPEQNLVRAGNQIALLKILMKEIS